MSTPEGGTVLGDMGSRRGTVLEDVGSRGSTGSRDRAQ